ncbi:MAG: hypothetical protein ACO1TE_19420 [Prosthecobacter sp.]
MKRPLKAFLWTTCLLVAVMAVTVAILLWLGPQKQYRSEQLQPFLEASQWTVFSLHPSPASSPGTSTQRTFQGYPVLGRHEMAVTSDLKTVVADLDRAGRCWRGAVSLCFWPRHGIAVTHQGSTHQGSTHELLICYECSEAQIFTNGTQVGDVYFALDDTEAEPTSALLDAVLKKAGVPQDESMLQLRRFNGPELYPITRAEWNVYRDEKRGRWDLWISVGADHAIFQQEDTRTLKAQPTWEINWSAETLKREDLAPGFVVDIPKGYVGTDAVSRHTNFYYTSHTDTDENLIKVVEADGDRLKLRLRGTTTDVNFYDGSKPETTLALETWFTRNPAGRRTFD